MEKLKKYWLWFVGFIGVCVGIFLVRPNARKTSNGISELQKAENKIREQAVENQRKEAQAVTDDVSKLNEERKPDVVADENDDMDKLNEEYKKL